MNKVKKNPVKTAIVILGIALVVVVPLQFFSPVIENPPVKNEIVLPRNVQVIFERACFDCHSNHSRPDWFGRVVPASYLIAHDVSAARTSFNFSDWNKNPPAIQELLLWEMVNAIEAHKMPLRSYLAFHPSANISMPDLAVLKAYVNTLPGRHKSDTGSIIKADDPGASRAKPMNFNIPVSPNGIKYTSDYKTWKIISVTDKYDGGSMRIVYGNDIMINTIIHRQLPFPDGAKIVKAVWGKQREDKDGNISPGNFQNVQVMIKDSRKYTSTDGWGFAKFEGLALKPAGKNALFANTCIRCHRLLVPENDFVFNIPTK